ncbi:hypothetical protein ACFYN3_40525 [Streptomyces lavendulae]|uniref:hypothetical protein n=1 Tax=Streptomyces lavendulae TaxID=1914 RepID=UPI00369A21AB
MLSVAGPFAPPAARSTDGTAGYFTIRLEEFPGRYGAAYLARFDEAVRNLRADVAAVETAARSANRPVRKPLSGRRR